MLFGKTKVLLGC